MTTTVQNIGQEVLGEWDLSGVQSGIDGLAARTAVLETNLPALSGQVTDLEDANFLAPTSGISGLAYMPEVDNTADLGASDLRFKDIYAANATIQTSDGRQKTEIQPFGNGLDFISRLQPTRFKFVGGTRVHYGFIAQQIQSVTNDAVVVQCNGIYGLRYSEFIAPMCAAIQELDRRWGNHDCKIESVDRLINHLHKVAVDRDKDISQLEDKASALLNYQNINDQRIVELSSKTCNCNNEVRVEKVVELDNSGLIVLQKRLNISYILTSISIGLAILGIIF